MGDLFAVPSQPTQTDQTTARDAGHTTSEHFFTKVLMICGVVISIGGFVGDAITAVAGIIPAGSSAFRIAGVVGAGVALVSKIAYEVSRTLVKMKLVDAEIAAANASGKKTPSDAAAAVLGEDAPENTP